MFGPRRTDIYANLKVEEHRAPTDESVRLLKEMEAAAQKKVDDAIRLNNNGFECVIHIEASCMDDRTVARALFSLNGKRLSADAWVHGRSLSRGSDLQITLLANLRDEVAKVIANEVLAAAWPRSL